MISEEKLAMLKQTPTLESLLQRASTIRCIFKDSISLPAILLWVMNANKSKLTGFLQVGKRKLMVSFKI